MPSQRRSRDGFWAGRRAARDAECRAPSPLALQVLEELKELDNSDVATEIFRAALTAVREQHDAEEDLQNKREGRACDGLAWTPPLHGALPGSTRRRNHFRRSGD